VASGIFTKQIITDADVSSRVVTCMFVLMLGYHLACESDITVQGNN
jgi:hypothetical protein